MIVRVDVRIENEPGDNVYGGYGNGLNFSEQATFQGGGFELVSIIFTRCHELLQALKDEHKRGERK